MHVRVGGRGGGKKLCIITELDSVGDEIEEYESQGGNFKRERIRDREREKGMGKGKMKKGRRKE